MATAIEGGGRFWRGVTLLAASFLACTDGVPSVARSTHALCITVDPDKELTVSDLSAIDDPIRAFDPCVAPEEPLPPWSFGKMMQIAAEQAGAPDAPAFVRNWLDTWTVEQVVNGHLLEPVPIGEFVTRPWLPASG